jgi:hypothetical protein
VKKLLTSLLAGCFLFSIVAISGCGKKDEKDTKKDTKPTDTKKDDTK